MVWLPTIPTERSISIGSSSANIPACPPLLVQKVRQYRGLVRKDEIDFVWKTRPSRRRQPGAYIRSGSLSFWDNGTRPLLADSTPTPAAVNSRWQRLHEYIRRLGAWKYFVISGKQLNSSF